MTTPNPTPTTLREILKTFRSKSIRAFDPPAEDYELAQKSLDQATRQIKEQIKTLTPQKKTIDTEHEYDQNTFNKGFNQAVKEIQKAIEEWAK